MTTARILRLTPTRVLDLQEGLMFVFSHTFLYPPGRKNQIAL